MSDLSYESLWVDVPGNMYYIRRDGKSLPATLKESFDWFKLCNFSYEAADYGPSWQAWLIGIANSVMQPGDRQMMSIGRRFTEAVALFRESGLVEKGGAP